MTAPIVLQPVGTTGHAWLRRLLIGSLLAFLAVVATLIVWFVLAYREFDAELGSSQRRLPQAVAARLTPAGSALEHPQVTLISDVGPEAQWAAPILFRTDPDSGLMALLSLPVVEGKSDTALINEVRRAARVPVNHTVIISLARVAPLVDALGGITVRNPNPAEYLLRNGRYWRFPATTLRLDGRHAVAFMLSVSDTTAPRRQQLILEGIIRALLAPSTLSEFSRKATAMTAALATDLTSGQVLAFAWLRFHSKYLLQCTLRSDDVSTGRSAQALAAFLGRTPVRPDRVPERCRLNGLPSPPIALPPTSVARVVASAYPSVLQVGTWAARVIGGAVLLLLLARAARWGWRVARKRRRGARRALHLPALRLPSLRFRAVRLRGLVQGIAARRADITVYTLAIVVPASLTYLAFRFG